MTEAEFYAAIRAVREIAPASLGDFAVRSMARAALQAAEIARQQEELDRKVRSRGLLGE